MRIGVMLPTFAPDAREALAVACEADEAGLHGVFAYDHLWPLGEPGRPAISPYPVLGAVAATTARVRLGTLVSRVGLVDDEVLLGELTTLDALSGGRLTAGVGTGDRKSAAENDAYGVPVASVEARQASLRRVVAGVRDAGGDVWVGGGLDSTNVIARELKVTLNVWAATPARVAILAAGGPVSWGGPWPGADAAPGRLVALRDAGATWAVFTWPGSLAPLLEAARAADIGLADAEGAVPARR